MDADSSEDDDALLSQATFKRPNRRETNKLTKMESALDEALEESKVHHESAMKIQRLRRENPDDDDEVLHARVGQIQESKQRTHSWDILDPKSLEQKSAMDADLMCRLGIRRGIVRFDASKGGCRFFHSMNESIQDLRRVFSLVEKHPLYDALRNAVDHGILAEFLQTPKLVHMKASLDFDQANLQLFHEWLLNLAYSAGMDNNEMELVGNSATKTLLSLRANGSFMKRIPIREYDDMLSIWIHDDNQLVQKLTKGETHTVDNRNLGGLRNFLTLWENAICLSTCGTDQVEASNCIARLVRLSLDEYCGTCVFDVQQRSLCDIVQLMTENTEDDDQLQFWINQTAVKTLIGLDELGPGSKGTDDSGDEQGCLCLSAAVRFVPIGTARGDSTKGVLLYQARLALCALHLLLVGDKSLGPPSVEEYVFSLLHDSPHAKLINDAASSLGWMAISATNAGLIRIDAKDDSATNPFELLSSLECLVVCYQAGLRLLFHEQTDLPDQSKEVIEYGSVEDARKFATYLDSFDELVGRIATRTSRRNASSSVFRLAHTVLLLLQLHNSTIRDRLKYLLRVATTKTPGEMEKQIKLSTFFTPKVNATNDDSQGEIVLI